MDMRILNLTDENLTLAARVLRSGGLIGLPTETVYGLAADAANDAAIARIYQAKGRPKFNPLIAHVSDVEMALQEGIFSRDALALVEKHWPGPLTVVVKVAPTGTVSELARAGLDSVALRIVDWVRRRLLRPADTNTQHRLPLETGSAPIHEQLLFGPSACVC